MLEGEATPPADMPPAYQLQIWHANHPKKACPDCSHRCVLMAARAEGGAKGISRALCLAASPGNPQRTKRKEQTVFVKFAMKVLLIFNLDNM